MGIDNSYVDLNLHLAVNKTNHLPWPNVKKKVLKNFNNFFS